MRQISIAQIESRTKRIATPPPVKRIIYKAKNKVKSYLYVADLLKSNDPLVACDFWYFDNLVFFFPKMLNKDYVNPNANRSIYSTYDNLCLNYTRLKYKLAVFTYLLDNKTLVAVTTMKFSHFVILKCGLCKCKSSSFFVC